MSLPPATTTVRTAAAGQRGGLVDPGQVASAAIACQRRRRDGQQQRRPGPRPAASAPGQRRGNRDQLCGGREEEIELGRARHGQLRGAGCRSPPRRLHHDEDQGHVRFASSHAWAAGWPPSRGAGSPARDGVPGQLRVMAPPMQPTANAAPTRLPGSPAFDHRQEHRPCQGQPRPGPYGFRRIRPPGQCRPSATRAARQEARPPQPPMTSTDEPRRVRGHPGTGFCMGSVRNREGRAWVPFGPDFPFFPEA